MATQPLHKRLALLGAEVLEPLRTPRPSQLRIVANAKLLIEGFDMPTVDLVMLAEAMRSPVQIQHAAAELSDAVQRVERLLPKHVS